jgi:hypothetical protein
MDQPGLLRGVRIAAVGELGHRTQDPTAQQLFGLA